MFWGTGDSILEVYFWMAWQGRSCITVMGPKVDEVGPKMAPTQP